MDTVVSGADSPPDLRDQIQQLALARIVFADPHAVILDESTTQLELADATEAPERRAGEPCGADYFTMRVSPPG